MKKLLLLTTMIILLSSQAWAICGVPPMRPVTNCLGNMVLMCEGNGIYSSYRWICMR